MILEQHLESQARGCHARLHTDRRSRTHAAKRLALHVSPANHARMRAHTELPCTRACMHKAAQGACGNRWQQPPMRRRIAAMQRVSVLCAQPQQCNMPSGATRAAAGPRMAGAPLGASHRKQGGWRQRQTDSRGGRKETALQQGFSAARSTRERMQQKPCQLIGSSKMPQQHPRRTYRQGRRRAWPTTTKLPLQLAKC